MRWAAICSILLGSLSSGQIVFRRLVSRERRRRIIVAIGVLLMGESGGIQFTPDITWVHPPAMKRSVTAKKFRPVFPEWEAGSGIEFRE